MTNNLYFNEYFLMFDILYDSRPLKIQRNNESNKLYFLTYVYDIYYPR